MKHLRSGRVGCVLLLLIAGCTPPPAADHDTTATTPSPTTSDRPSTRADSRDSSPRETTAAGREGRTNISWDTDRDRVFAEFLRDKAGSMLRDAAVGIERRGVLRVRLDESVNPDDTLDLTKSLMAGARKDFPDRPIRLELKDPKGDPILNARYQPGQGIQYDLAGEPGGGTEISETRGSGTADSRTDADSGPLARSGRTRKDREFAAWAEDHGRAYLRYVQADLERNGRLWFGVTGEVKPRDVPDLTRSLLSGASKEFPGREIVATVFDPDGEKIGRARLGKGDRIDWER